MRTKSPTTKWLIEAKTLEELKALYRKLAFTHHPDLGGNTVTMQEINAEYEYRLKLLETGQSWHSYNGSGSYNRKSYSSNNNNNSSSNNNNYSWDHNYHSYSEPPPPPPSSEKPDPKAAKEAYDKAFAYASKANPYFHVAILSDGEVVAYGRTFAHRDFLRDNGFWWDPERRVWHFVRKPFSPFD